MRICIAAIKPMSANTVTKIYKVAGGANVADYHWTETLMKNAHWLMDGLSLHYYVHPQGWEEKGSALEFNEAEWQVTCEKQPTWMNY